MMRCRYGRALVAGLLLCGFVLPAAAADLPTPALPPNYVMPAPLVPSSPYGILSEARFGLLAHSIDEHEFGSVDVNGELLTVKPTHLNGAWDYLIPRFHLGGNLNTAGGTSDVYGGVTWQFPIYERIFGEVTFGGSANDGNADRVITNTTDDRVGCHVMFRESGSIGYRLTEHWNVMALAEHISNAGFCLHNEGVTNMGARLGYVF